MFSVPSKSFGVSLLIWAFLQSSVVSAGRCVPTVELLCGLDDLSVLCGAVTTSGLVDALSEGTFTLFAPPNDAFENLGAALDDVVANEDLLREVLLFHVVPGAKIAGADLECSSRVEMANGQDTRTICRHSQGEKIFQKGGGNPPENPPEIIAFDIETCEGFVHVVDEVLLPGRQFRIEAPVSESEDEPSSEEVEPSSEDAPAPTPPRIEAPVAAPVESPTSEDEEDACFTVTEAACGSSDFTILCAALELTGLKDALDTEDAEVTVFAPTDAAFVALGDATLNALTSSPEGLEDLADILLFHVTDGRVFTQDLVCGGLLSMKNGIFSQTVCIGDEIFQKGGRNPASNKPQILSGNIEACRSVIHVVDEVLLF